MKSSAGNPALRRSVGAGAGVQHQANKQQQEASNVPTSAGRSPGTTPQPQHLGLASAGLPVTAAATPATTGNQDVLAEQDPGEQASLVEAKKAIDHLKSVTGNSRERRLSFIFKFALRHKLLRYHSVPSLHIGIHNETALSCPMQANFACYFNVSLISANISLT